MPGIKIQHVVSCSSEDSLHKANNLLNAESFRKWKCAQAGEKQASVILQLEKSSVIHSIDIGNDGSAFVEVLVGHSTSDNPEDYQVILVTSSFMNPIESKNGTNSNRVRMFGPDKLCKTALEKHWDRVKIVCTQPFNKHISYGISFIKLHSPPVEPDTTSPPSQKMLGKFTIKEDPPATLIRAGSFFKDRNKEEQPRLKGAAAIRAASYTTTETPGSSSPAPANTSSKEKTPTITKKVTPHLTTTTPSVPSTTSDSKQAKKRKLSNDKPGERPSSESSKGQPKRRHSEEKKEETKKKIDDIMKGVRFVISGYQNPYRGELRDKAMRMGAEYEGNWGPRCTHLICAVVNTPKYQQVRGKGKIVTKDWILDSYKKRFLQPWQRYKLDKDQDSSSSEEESEPEDVQPPAKKRPSSTSKREEESKAEQLSSKMAEDKPQTQTKITEKNTSQEQRKEVKVEQSSVTKKPEEDNDDSTDVESIGDGDKTKDTLGSDADTEDELKQIQAKGNNKDDPFADSTDDEVEVKEDLKNGEDIDWDNIPKLPDFFRNKNFMFYGKFAAEDRRQLYRFVVAFGGKEKLYMGDAVDFVVTESKWDNGFDEALKENQSLVFVSPRWLHLCNRKGEMVSYTSYQIQKV